MSEDIYRQASRDEFEIAVEWAAREGWNPGLDDSEIFWQTDPEGFVCVERDGEVIATGSIVSYRYFGFMGFFIVREDLRGQGIGAPFWHWRKQRLLDRLDPGGAIGMDGVFEMQSFYARGGFQFTHRNIRMEGTGRAARPDSAIVELAEVPFDSVADWDRRGFGFPRETFLRHWISPRHGSALGFWKNETLHGFGIIRQCRTGYKVGPLFADSEEVAESLFAALANEAEGEALFLDTPEINSPALALASRWGMKEVFGCARMIAGPIPSVDWNHVYGVTTFELG